MVGKTEAKTRMAKKEVEKKGATEEKEKVRSYRKSPSRAVVEKSTASLSRPVTPPKTVKVPEKPSTSPARGRPPLVRSQLKSPQRLDQTSARKKSPARKSPGRKPAVRASPPKTRQSPARKTPPRKSPSRRSPIKRPEEKVTKKIYTVDLDSDSESNSGISEFSKSSYLAKLRISMSREGSTESVTRRSSRLRDFERVVHLKNNYEPVAKLTEFSDEDEVVVETKQEEPKKQVQTHLPNFRYVNLFMTIVDLIISLFFLLGMLLLCNDLECAYKVPTSKSFNRILSYFDLTAILYTTLYSVFIIILSAIPFGGKKCCGPLTRASKFDYNMNGLFCAFVTFFALVTLQYFTGNAVEYIHDNLYKLLVSSFLLSFVFATLVYIKSFYVPISHLNSNVLENSFLFNYVYGCENNPRFGNIDVKTVMFRASYISTLIASTIGAYQSIDWTTRGAFELSNALNFLQLDHVNWTGLTISVMIIFFILDAFVFEHTWMNTAELQYESFGFMKCIEYCVFVNFFGLLPKTVLDNNLVLESWKLILAISTFVIGYIIYRGSILQKHAFRENPYSPYVAHLESIPTAGKKIICSSYWGFVRHPNYLGDLIITLSFLIFLYANPLGILSYISILKLFQRAYNDNNRCKQRYGTAWERYSQRVKYILIPKIY